MIEKNLKVSNFGSKVENSHSLMRIVIVYPKLQLPHAVFVLNLTLLRTYYNYKSQNTRLPFQILMTFTRKRLFMGVFSSHLSTFGAPFNYKYPLPTLFLTRKGDLYSPLRALYSLLRLEGIYSLYG